MLVAAVSPLTVRTPPESELVTASMRRCSSASSTAADSFCARVRVRFRGRRDAKIFVNMMYSKKRGEGISPEKGKIFSSLHRYPRLRCGCFSGVARDCAGAEQHHGRDRHPMPEVLSPTAKRAAVCYRRSSRLLF